MSAIVRSRRPIALAAEAKAVSGSKLDQATVALTARALPREHARDTSATAARAVESTLIAVLLVRASVAHR